jgi:hypothetical protein
VRKPGGLLVASVAWVCVVLGHLTAYLVAYPIEGPRHDHLALTGHSWVGVAAASALAIVPVVLVAVAVRALGSSDPWPRGGLAFRLAAIQVPAFAAIEVVERGGSVARTVSDPAVIVGLVLLPLLAVIAAWLLDLFRRAVRTVVHGSRRACHSTIRPVLRPALQQIPDRHLLLLPARRRAPPLTAAA